MLSWRGKKKEIRCYEYVPVLNRNRDLEESLEWKEAKKPYRATPPVQVLTPQRGFLFLLSIMLLQPVFKDAVFVKPVLKSIWILIPVHIKMISFHLKIHRQV